MWPLLRIVDSLTDSRVLFDFNAGRDVKDRKRKTWTAADEFSLGSPTWDTSPSGIVEGTREITIPLRAAGARAEAYIAQLAQALTRTESLYLQWQVRKDSAPVWFKLHPSITGGELGFDRVWWEDADKSVYEWKVTLVADSFAYGAREEITAMSGLMGDAGDIGKPVVIPNAIKGTAPTPLCLDLSTGNLSGFRCQVITWAADEDLINEDNYRAAPYVMAKTLTVNSSDNGTVAVQDDGTLRVNGSYNTAGNLSGVLGYMDTSKLISSYGYLVPGQYRALVYLSRTEGSGACRLMCGVQDETSVGQNNGLFLLNEGTTVAPKGNDIGYWVDTGRLNLPAGQPFEGLTSKAMGQVNNIGVSLQGDGDSNTKWVVGGLILVPVRSVILRGSSTTLSAQWSRYQINSVNMRIDGNAQRIGVLAAGTGGSATQDVWQTYIPPAVDGQFPMLQPGARNYLFFIPRVNNVETKYRVGGWGTSGDTTGWYHPKYLHVSTT